MRVNYIKYESNMNHSEVKGTGKSSECIHCGNVKGFCGRTNGWQPDISKLREAWPKISECKKKCREENLEDVDTIWWTKLKSTDASVFPFGILPYFIEGDKTGQVNPCGQWYQKNQAQIDFDKAHIEKIGYKCSKCGVYVDRIGRAYFGAKEPINWWWCDECRENSDAMTEIHGPMDEHITITKKHKSGDRCFGICDDFSSM